MAHLPGTLAVGAGFPARAVGRPRTLARGTRLVMRILYLDLCAEHRVPERNLDVVIGRGASFQTVYRTQQPDLSPPLRRSRGLRLPPK